MLFVWFLTRDSSVGHVLPTFLRCHKVTHPGLYHTVCIRGLILITVCIRGLCVMEMETPESCPPSCQILHIPNVSHVLLLFTPSFDPTIVVLILKLCNHRSQHLSPPLEYRQLAITITQSRKFCIAIIPQYEI